MNELNRHRFPSQLATALRAGPDVGDDDKLQACPPPPAVTTVTAGERDQASCYPVSTARDSSGANSNFPYCS